MIHAGHDCRSVACDCYARGLSDGRRTVEAEFAAERASIALLAAALADAAEGICLRLNPADATLFDGAGCDLPITADPRVAAGTIRLTH